MNDSTDALTLSTVNTAVLDTSTPDTNECS